LNSFATDSQIIKPKRKERKKSAKSAENSFLFQINMVESAAKASASAYLNIHNEKFATDSQISKCKEYKET
jgi:hypothetical protein